MLNLSDRYEVRTLTRYMSGGRRVTLTVGASGSTIALSGFGSLSPADAIELRDILTELVSKVPVEPKKAPVSP